MNDHTIEQFERAGENFEKADAALGIAQCALLCKDPSAKLMRALEIYKSKGNQKGREYVIKKLMSKTKYEEEAGQLRKSDLDMQKRMTHEFKKEEDVILTEDQILRTLLLEPVTEN